MKCGICGDNLGTDNRPLKYCEWQQGRCPHQKQSMTILGHIFLTGIFTFLFLLIWLTT